MFKKIKPYMMPLAMTTGAVFHQFFGSLAFLTPYLIFTMLFLTYCKLNFKHLQLSGLHLWLILIQILGCVIVYYILSPWNLVLAQGVMICMLAPTGTAAPVVTGMLKGNVESLTAYSLLSNLSVAIAAPLIFSLLGSYETLPFFDSFLAISRRVFVLLLTPFVLAIVLKKISPETTAKIGSFSGLSFYIWSFSLIIVTAKTVEFILQQNSNNYTTEILVAAGALVACIGQFVTGKKIGKKYNDTIAGGQSLGQKNTILAIWMAQMFLNPISSIAPGAYVLWQNIFNSYQVWQKRKLL
ncbi:MAG TPA: transporter [Paludibacteraceae bacterium]|nr:transporter [Paludibacteraceae bacterium]